jgi:hypothetical protein
MAHLNQPPARAVLAELKSRGLLLQQDRELPSVVGLVLGEALKTSWWSHPRAQQVFLALSALNDHEDVLFTKLLSGKSTLVHRSLWPALLAVGRAREPWQMQRLPATALRALDAVEESAQPVRAKPAVVKELESRLLVTAHEVHTESGRHERLLESWRRWAKRVDCSTKLKAPAAREALEAAARGIGAAEKAFPWRGRRDGDKEIRRDGDKETESRELRVERNEMRKSTSPRNARPL